MKRGINVEETAYIEDSLESSLSSSSSSSSSMSSEEDEESLLDEEALCRVRSLRGKVRDAVKRTIDFREEIPKLAIDLTLEKLNAEQDKSYVNTSKKEIRSTPLCVSSMRNSLGELSVSLGSLKNTLPEKISGLQETTEAIQSCLEKHRMAEKNCDALSATERALFSKTNDGRFEKEVAREERKNQENEIPTDYFSSP